MKMILRSVYEDKIDVDKYLKEFSVSSLPFGSEPICFYNLYKKYYEKYPDIEDESEESTKAYEKVMEKEDKMLRIILKTFIEYLMDDGYVIGEDK